MGYSASKAESLNENFLSVIKKSVHEEVAKSSQAQQSREKAFLSFFYQPKSCLRCLFASRALSTIPHPLVESLLLIRLNVHTMMHTTIYKWKE